MNSELSKQENEPFEQEAENKAKRKVELFKEGSNKKLYVVRDVEGKPNHEELAIIRELEEKLSEDPDFIGLVPHGSVIGGYNIKSGEYESDIDLCVLYKKEKAIKGEKLPDLQLSIKNETGRDMNLQPLFIDLELLQHFRLPPFYNTLQQYHYREAIISIAEISRIVTGKKIDAYRNEIRSKLQKLPIESQREILEQILMHLMGNEVVSLKKRGERIRDLSEKDHQEILEKRREMWRKRVQKIWGLTVE